MIRRDIVVIAASEGGPNALCQLANQMDASFPGSLLVVQHVAPDGPQALAQIMQRHTSLAIEYARTGTLVEKGHMYLAPPGNHHLVVSPQRYLRLVDGPKIHFVRPAADPLFESAAAHFGARVVGVVLTGYDGDGTRGLRAIKRADGVTIVQHPAQSKVPDMPMNALNGDSPDYSVSIEELARLLKALAIGNEAPFG